VVGLVEGAFPRSTRDDSLLPDQVKALARGLLLPRPELAQFDLRAVAAVVVCAGATALLTTSRGDLRSRRAGAWPRMLDFLVAERTSLASHHQGIVGHGRPASSIDLGLRSLAVHVDGGDPVHTHALASTDEVLAGGLTRQQLRSTSAFNRFSGQVAVGMVDPVERVLSPTALESYAACPRRYLFDRVLRLSQTERPERVAEITPRERGSLMHAILERFIGDAVAGTLPGPSEPWDAAAVTHLLVLLDRAVLEPAELGVTGGRVQTEILRRDLRNELLQFVVTDDQLRAERGARPHAVELAFGFDPEPPAVVQLADGRRLRMRGSVDRVDLTDDDGLLVIDYKGGSDRPFVKMDEDPLAGGRRLQLPLYARIVAERLGRSGPRTALYWLTKSNKLKPIELDEALDVALEAHLGAALDGIAGGLFPGVPGGTLGWPRLTFENCQYCDFDRVCPTDRQREWDAVSADPKLTKVELLLGRGPAAVPSASVVPSGSEREASEPSA
ncbi:MAG: PD-(D/E)XK nuclease family protein, partial [Actinomycetota bacterium]|nr:PD-(D/E)XK nuclease family protein [Actinomycetota bacterium]